MGIEPFTLRGEHVELIPLALEHVDELTAGGDRRPRRRTGSPRCRRRAEAMTDYVGRMLALAARRRGACRSPSDGCADGRLVGCTRFMELRWWRGRDEPDEVEIGGTWLAADAQRSPINTEAKLLLLTHAFERWGVVRVALATDSRNARSRTAIERIGARYEGMLRHHRPVDRRGRSRPAARHGAVRDHRRRLAGAYARQLERRLRSPTVGD